METFSPGNGIVFSCQQKGEIMCTRSYYKNIKEVKRTLEIFYLEKQITAIYRGEQHGRTYERELGQGQD